MKLTKQELMYCKAVYQEIYQKHSLEKGFSSFLGSDVKDFFKEQFPQIRFYIYRPNFLQKRIFIQVLQEKILEKKAILVRKIFHEIGLFLSIEDLKNALFSKKGFEYDLIRYLFGSSFLNDFRAEEFSKIPLFEKFLTQDRNYFDILLSYSCYSFEAFCKKVKMLEKSDTFFEQIFNDLKNFSFVLDQYVKMPNSILPSVISTFTGTHEKEGKKEKFLNRWNMSHSLGDLGTFTFFLRRSYIYLPVFTSLDSIFHEVGHAYSSEVIADFRDFHPLAFPFFSRCCVLSGVFNLPYLTCLEVFNDYISVQSCKENLSHSWPYVSFFSGSCSSLYPIIIPFWKAFSPLILYSLKEKRVDVFYELLGNDFLKYQKFLESLEDVKKVSNLDILYVESLIVKMKQHFKNYEFQHYQRVQEHISNLESQGKKVRVLHLGMEKLQKEEQLYQGMVQELS